MFLSGGNYKTGLFYYIIPHQLPNVVNIVLGMVYAHFDHAYTVVYKKPVGIFRNVGPPCSRRHIAIMIDMGYVIEWHCVD